jgi:hypothetical protein
MKRAIVLLTFSVCACGIAASEAGSYAERAGEIVVRLEVTHARTMRACGLGERDCAAAAVAATASLRRLRSDLVALRFPTDLLVAKRAWLVSLDLYSQANDALQTPSCAEGNREPCLRMVYQVKRTIDGSAAAALASGVAAR